MHTMYLRRGNVLKAGGGGCYNNATKFQATQCIVHHIGDTFVAAIAFIVHNMLPRIDQLPVQHNFVATKPQRRVVCCMQQYSTDTVGDLLHATKLPSVSLSL